MADLSIKEQKLAAARKKLKKYQKKRAEVFPKASRSGDSSPYLDMLCQQSETSSSRSSSVADISECGSNKIEQYSENDVTESNANHDTQEYVTKESSIVKNDHHIYETTSDANILLTSSYQVPLNATSDTKDSNFYSIHSSDLNPLKTDEELDDLLKYKNSNLSDEKGAVIPSEKYTTILEQSEYPEYESSICSETNASLTTVIQLKNDESSCNQAQNTALKSTTESLRQLSLQISGLVNDVEIPDPNRQEIAIMELERRNNELASLLETEKQKSTEGNAMVAELKKTIESQDAQIQQLQKMSIADSNGTEVHGLREQLQVHIQTIGILVAEKSELHTSLSHTRYALDQKSGEITDLQGRLDASRERIKSLETSNQDLRNKISALTNTKETDSQQLLNLQSSYAKLSKLCDEMRASTAELTERLAVRTEENQKLNIEILDIRREYELAQVHVEQLKTNSTEDLRKQFDELQSLFNDSQKQVSNSKVLLEQMENEKQQMQLEYKSYASQLAADVEDLKEKLANESKSLASIEKQKEEFQHQLMLKENDAKLMTSLETLQEEKNHLIKSITTASEIRQQLEEKCSTLVRDNGQLSQLLAEQSAKLEALETAVDRNNTYQVDTSQLLQSMQSDKIAASRALTQNKQLKEQLEELQNGFIMMSNKKLELTEKLERELHFKKGLYKEIAELGEQLSTYKQDLLSKQREIGFLKTNKGGVLESNPAIDSTMDKERRHSINGVCNHNHDEHHDSAHDDDHTCNTVKSLKELASENQIIENHSSDQKSNDCNKETLSDSRDAITIAQMNYADDSLKIHGESDVVPFEVAHKALEVKFLKCMKDLAAMSDEKQNLEHLVQQLQLETDTVGDYITIYQFQRGVMKQQMNELNMELDLLKTEKRETLKKLSKLQALIESLADDEGFSAEGFLHGINSIMNETITPSLDADPAEEAVESSASNDTALNPTPVHTKGQEKSKNQTVRQIIELLGEMESAHQLDVSTFSRVHPCAHCSGKLITI